jgi:DNA-binding PadR family transcriptional regulator
MFFSHHHGRHNRRFARAEFGWHGHRHHHRHGGRAGRLFEHGDLRFIVLELIAEKPRHGYEIIKAIEDRLGGGYSPSPGVVYPTLTLLEELGYATVTATEGSRKLYAITEEGRAFLAANRATVDALFARMAEIGADRASSHAPQLIRAMENLKMAMRLRTSGGPLSESQIDAIAAALDTAAHAIERA